MKVADFGLAKLGPAAGEARLTEAEPVMGTPHYRSPEQVARPLDVDHRTDIFPLGVVIYELLTGELPLGRFPPPSQRADVDPQLDVVVMRALESMSDARQPKVSVLQRELEDVLGRARIEYRSRRTVAGWLLVHVVFGPIREPVAARRSSLRRSRARARTPIRPTRLHEHPDGP